MSAEPRLITVCSSCEAKFYVTQDQLSAHNGDVRCGKCGHVFNALSALNQLPESKPAVKDEAEITNQEHSEHITKALEQEERHSQNTSTLPAFQFSDFKKPKISSTEMQDEAAVLEDAHISEAIPVFEEDDNRTPFRVPSWIFGLLIFLLVLLAAAQSTYYLRTEIASRLPESEPYLKLACIYLDCTVELPQHIEQIMVDDSDLQEDAERVGLIHLSSTLINNASFTQAYPLLELTLTDTFEKPKLRRAFTPEEYLDPSVDINKGFLPGDEVHLKLAISTDGEPVVGYRVFLRYQ